jgi:hypothetical protein
MSDQVAAAADCLRYVMALHRACRNRTADHEIGLSKTYTARQPIALHLKEVTTRGSGLY